MATELKPAEVESWWKVITDFPGYWRSFNENYQALLKQSAAVYETHPEMRPEIDRLVNEGSQLYAKLLDVKNAIDSIQNTFSSVGTTIQGWLQDFRVGYTGSPVTDFGPMAGFGIIPIIWIGMGVATAAGVLIAVSQWLTKVQATAVRLNRIQELEAKGMSPQQASAQVTNELGAPGGEATFLGIPIKFVAVAAVLIFVMPPLFSYLSSRSK